MFISREREREREREGRERGGESGRMGWAGKVTEIGKTVNKNKFQLENLIGRPYLK
jgi:hypothetical protein